MTCSCDRRGLATLRVASPISRVLDRLRSQFVARRAADLFRRDVPGLRTTLAREVGGHPCRRGAARPAHPPMAAAHGHHRGARRRAHPGRTSIESARDGIADVSSTARRANKSSRCQRAEESAPRHDGSSDRSGAGSPSAVDGRRLGRGRSSSPRDGDADVHEEIVQHGHSLTSAMCVMGLPVPRPHRPDGVHGSTVGRRRRPGANSLMHNPASVG